MEWVTTWINGISDTWLRIFALAGSVGVVLGAYQMVTGWQANKRLKRLEAIIPRIERQEQDICTLKDLFIQEFGKRTEIQGAFEANKAEMTASVGVRRKKKPGALLNLLRRLYLKVKDR